MKEKDVAHWIARKQHSSLCTTVLVHHHKDLFSDLVSRVDNPECKLQVRDFNLLSDRFSAPTSNLLALHHRHLKGT
jgi:hypothetical protein